MQMSDLRKMFERYVLGTKPDDLYDRLDGEIALDKDGNPQWCAEQVLQNDRRFAVLTIRRYHVIDEYDEDKAEEWAKGFAEFAGVKLRASTTRILRDKGADYDIEVEVKLDLRMPKGRPVTGGGGCKIQATGNAVALRDTVKSVADNIRIHLASPAQGIEMNRKELEAMLEECERALAAPARNCDRYADKSCEDTLHADFVKYCNACDCPMGCNHRKDTRCMLDTRCASILKCFSRFVLERAEPRKDAEG